MANPALAGFVYSSNGQGVNAISVNVYAAGDTTTKISSATTDATGAWSITNSSVQNPDIELVNGTEITRFKYGDKIALTQADVQTFVVRNDTATSSFAVTINPTTLTAHRSITLPNASGEVALITAGNRVLQSSGSTQQLLFDVSALSTTRTITMPNSSGAPLIVNSSNESNGDSVFVETNIVTERFAQYIPLTKYVSFNSSANGYSRISGSAITLQAAETVAMQTVFHISLSDTVQSPVFKYAGSTNAVQVDGHAIFDRDGGSTVIYINENSSITMTKALFTGSTFATLEVNARVVASATDTFAWYMKMSGAGAAAATVEAWTTYQKYL